MEKIFSLLSSGFIPIMSAVIISYGLAKKVPVYDIFIEGAKKGLKTALDILPFLIGIYLAINGLTASGFLNFIDKAFSGFFDFIGLPSELLPLIFLRAISGSGSFIIVEDILQAAGPDSYAGRAACVMAGGCETVIYVLALYFSATKVKNLRHAFAGGIIGYITGIITSLIICNYL